MELMPTRMKEIVDEGKGVKKTKNDNSSAKRGGR
jgi:hypothetical protein